MHPLTEVPNWISSPIPHYTPAPFYQSVKVNDLSPIEEQCFNQTNPEYPTLYNSFENVIVFPNSSIVTPDYFFPHFTFYFDQKIPKPFKTEISPKYDVIDQAIPFFHMYLKTYYHFIIEIFPLIFCYPKSVVENSVLLHSPMMRYQFNELCLLLDINFKRKIEIKKAVYVKKLYVPNPNIFIEFNANAVRHFRRLLIEKCNASSIKATQNVYYNRHRNRLILNFNELKIQLKKELPDYEFVEPNGKKMAEQVVFWRKTKFVMLVHGSIFSNFIFMRPNTVYLEFSIRVCRNAAQKLCQSFGIHIYQMMFRNHCLNRSMYADIPELIPLIKKILDMLEKQDLSLY